MSAINNVGDLTGALQRFQNNQLIKVNGQPIVAVIGQRAQGTVNIYITAAPRVSPVGDGITSSSNKLLEED